MSEPVDPNPPWQPEYSGPPRWQPPVPMAPPGPQLPPGPQPWQQPAGWQQPGDYLPYPPAPAPARSHTGLILAVVAAVVVIVGGVVAAVLVLRGSDGPAKVAAPRSVGSYAIATGAGADRVSGAIRGFASGVGGSAAKLMNSATIAVYSDSGDVPDLIFVGLTRSQASDAGAPDGDQPMVAGLLAGAAPNNQAFDPGSHGGVLRCGSATFGAASESLCAWSDSHTVGMLVSVNPAKATAVLARTANQFRDAVD